MWQWLKINWEKSIWLSHSPFPSFYSLFPNRVGLKTGKFGIQTINMFSNNTAVLRRCSKLITQGYIVQGCPTGDLQRVKPWLLDFLLGITAPATLAAAARATRLPLALLTCISHHCPWAGMASSREPGALGSTWSCVAAGAQGGLHNGRGNMRQGEHLGDCMAVRKPRYGDGWAHVICIPCGCRPYGMWPPATQNVDSCDIADREELKQTTVQGKKTKELY